MVQRKTHPEPIAKTNYFIINSTGSSQVAHALSFMYTPREHAERRWYRVLSMACPSFLTVADLEDNIGATR
jgi:hypothetical protein